MKKSIILFALACLSSMSPAQIRFNGNLETGYIDRVVSLYDSAANDPTSGVYFKNGLYFALELTVDLKGLELYANNQTTFSYFLHLNEYQLGARYTLTRFIMGYDHMRSRSIEEKYFSESYDRFFVDLRFRDPDPPPSGKIDFNGGLEIGYEKRSVRFYYPPRAEPYFLTSARGSLYDVLKVNVSFKGFCMYALNKTYFHPEKLFSYNPFLIEYVLGVKYTGENFVLGYEHMCTHSIERKQFMDGYDRFSLRVRLFGKSKNSKYHYY